MEMALAILFGSATILLILSLASMKRASKVQKEQVDTYYVAMLEETSKLQEQIAKMQLDGEITAQEAGIVGMDSKERALLRELLDLHKRGYTIKSMSSQTRLAENEIEQLLAPYVSSKKERRNVSHVS
ncbi:hypothetical protein WQ57_15525 [Mesobacillus campisalis]|uniref:Uncharacterized protein n=1 Tax=Mesobacillus campisalis TaxID=1408103 RepID=A0A0M2SRC5_9BACI|nr:hypothetical protein [Mesobacillus campisalis]KKK37134.1 hypothetical protein WQ57_15525 [Mesobacillus campisalis]